MRLEGFARTAMASGVVVARAALALGILAACAVVVFGLFFSSIAVTRSLAQNPQPGATQGAQKTWKPGELHTGNTRIYVHVFKTGLGHEHAVAGMVKEGELHLGATQHAGHVVADLSSFIADPDYARRLLGLPAENDDETKKKVTSNMLGAEVLDVLQFPTATANIESARLLPQRSKNGLPQYLLEGELTLHGVAKKMSVVAEATEQNGWVRLRGQVSIKQSDFGMKPFTAMLGAIGVADELDIYGEAYIVKDSDIPAPVATSGSPQ
jgi:hypothetical protein